ncbi:MAG: 50S ribosomal protein L22 [Thermoplasmatota archaeon]
MGQTYYSAQSDPESTARAYGKNLRCSPKSGRNVALYIKGMPLSRAKEVLEQVVELKRPVPFRVRVRKIHHRRGTGFGPGRYPVQVAKEFLKILTSLEANAEYKELDKERLVITHASAYQGEVVKGHTPRAQGRATAHYDRKCNFEVIATEIASGDEETTKERPKTAKGKAGPAKGAKAEKAAHEKEHSHEGHSHEGHAHDKEHSDDKETPKAPKKAAKESKAEKKAESKGEKVEG